MSSRYRLLVLALAFGAAAASADETFRCGKWLITSDLTLGEIIAKCGPPAVRTSRTEDVHVMRRDNGRMMRSGTTTVETLTWDRGTRAAAMVVIVEDGKVKSVDRKP